MDGVRPEIAALTGHGQTWRQECGRDGRRVTPLRGCVDWCDTPLYEAIVLTDVTLHRVGRLCRPRPRTRGWPSIVPFRPTYRIAWVSPHASMKEHVQFTEPRPGRFCMAMQATLMLVLVLWILFIIYVTR